LRCTRPPVPIAGITEQISQDLKVHQSFHTTSALTSHDVLPAAPRDAVSPDEASDAGSPSRHRYPAMRRHALFVREAPRGAPANPGRRRRHSSRRQGGAPDLGYSERRHSGGRRTRPSATSLTDPPRRVRPPLPPPTARGPPSRASSSARPPARASSSARLHASFSSARPSARASLSPTRDALAATALEMEEGAAPRRRRRRGIQR
ncbi:hypothetical protein PVAP13_5NG642732, partial [Panicum virgatum]